MATPKCWITGSETAPAPDSEMRHINRMCCFVLSTTRPHHLASHPLLTLQLALSAFGLVDPFPQTENELSGCT